MHPSEHKKLTHYSPLVVLSTFGILVGMFITIIGSQQNTDTRSRAAFYAGTYNGTLTGDAHIVGGGVTEDLIGSNNVINSNVEGCVIGNNNIIGGRVSGTVSGTGNLVAGGFGSGPCLSSQSSTSQTVTLSPVADATVFQNSPSNNHGLKTELQVENDPIDSSGGVDYSYLKFDLSAYAGKTITSAKLRLRTMNTSSSNTNGTVYVNWVTNTSWTETGITYNNKPSISSTVLGSAKPLAINTPYEFTLTTSQLSSALGGLATVALTTTSDDAASFNSKEVSTGKPELVLTFANVTPTSVLPTVIPTVTKTPTPTPTTVPSSSIVFTINKTTYNRGESITAYWQNIPNATPRDWIGLYTPSMANGSEIGWIYLNCTQNATVAKPTGECTFPIPDTAPAGTLELRLHPNDGNTVLAKSPTFTLNGAAATVAPTAIPTQSASTPTPTSAATVVPTAPVATSTLVPTTVPQEGETYVGVNLLLHGIGKGGDAVNPISQGNMSPLHPQRTVSIDVYNAQNQLVASKHGVVTFNVTTGSFTGNVSVGNTIATGAHTIRIKADQYLRGVVSGIQMLTAGQTKALSSLTLVSGDVNNDNAINIVDYNIIVGCYSDLLPPVSCNDVNKLRADLTDDDKVNQFDYNLFIRELTNLGGQ